MRHVDGYSIFGEIPLSGPVSGHRSVTGGTAPLSQAFITSKEKEFVAKDLASGSGPKLVATERWLLASRVTDVIEQVSGIQHIITKEVIGGTMQAVGSGFGGGVNLAGSPTKLCGVGIGLNFELLNLIDRRHRRKSVKVRLYIS